MTAPITTIVVNEEYTYEFNDGRTSIYKDGKVVLDGHFVGSKMLISALFELEDRRLDIGTLNQRLHDGEVFVVPPHEEAPSEVDVEDRKYTISTGARQEPGEHEFDGVRLYRHGVDPFEVPEPAFFYAVAYELFNARRYYAVLRGQLIEHGLAGFGLRSEQH